MRILIIEDDDNIANALKRGLDAEGFVVDVATTGPEGLGLATRHDYEAIILDIMLPEMNGYLVCRELRAASNWTPVLILTAKDGEYDEAEGLETGADDYLVKPFSFVVLLARLRALIRRSGRVEPTVVYQCGDLSLDPTTHRCQRGGVDIELTAKELVVLQYLIHRKGQVVTKTEVLDNVWDFAYEGDVNIVEVYIRHLRKKIDEPFGRRSIRTIRGVGYRLEDG